MICEDTYIPIATPKPLTTISSGITKAKQQLEQLKQLEQELAYLDHTDDKYKSIKKSIDKIKDDNEAIVTSQKEFTKQLEKKHI